MIPMTEPQELRSIDELFRNAFNNLPESPAGSAWDVPSERVWQHVRDTIRAPRLGWGILSPALLAGFAVALAVGLYFAFSNPEKTAEQPIPVAIPINTGETHAGVGEIKSEQSLLVAPTETAATPSPVIGNSTHKSNRKKEKLPSNPSSSVLVAAKTSSQTTGAQPLPGTNSAVKPNTTEERKAEHAQQMELLWSTPIRTIPVPSYITVKH